MVYEKLTTFVNRVKDICGVKGVEWVALGSANRDASDSNDKINNNDDRDNNNHRNTNNNYNNDNNNYRVSSTQKCKTRRI